MHQHLPQATPPMLRVVLSIVGLVLCASVACSQCGAPLACKSTGSCTVPKGGCHCQGGSAAAPAMLSLANHSLDMDNYSLRDFVLFCQAWGAAWAHTHRDCNMHCCHYVSLLVHLLHTAAHACMYARRQCCLFSRRSMSGQTNAFKACLRFRLGGLTGFVCVGCHWETPACASCSSCGAA